MAVCFTQSFRPWLSLSSAANLYDRAPEYLAKHIRSRLSAYRFRSTALSSHCLRCTKRGMANSTLNSASSHPKSSDSYLSGFVQLGPQLYFFEPEHAKSSPSGILELKDLPDLIVVCSWMGAASRYVSKYTKVYQSRFTGVPILLLKQDGSDLFWRPNKWQMENLRPAVSVIEKYVQETNGQTRILFHLFSNGGAYSVCQLADAYKLFSSSNNKTLPMSALVLDSLPSLPNIWRTHSALTEMLPKTLPLRLFGEVVIWSFILSSRTMDYLGIAENVLPLLRKKLNTKDGPFMQGSLKRMYIYSNEDKLVPWQEVEDHAREAAEIIGKDRVLLENFKTSRHVGHVMKDEQRYWGLIEQLWNNVVSR